MPVGWHGEREREGEREAEEPMRVCFWEWRQMIEKVDGKGKKC